MDTIKFMELQTDPARFISETIKEYVASSMNNIMPDFEGEPIWDEPLVGFADGDDPIFQQYKEIIGEFHLTPREAMEKHLNKITRGYSNPQRVSVISFVLPSTTATRDSMRRETKVCSSRWNYTRHYGQEVNYRLSRYLVTALENAGYHAIAPDQERFFEVKRDDPANVASTWSQRHIAYAAGLGTFSLNDSLITSRGSSIRVGSVIIDLPVEPTPRPYKNHLEYCLFYRDEKCGICIQRCPAGAISEKGHDKVKCRHYLYDGMPEAARELGRNEAFVGNYWGCGFCQTKVPCERGIPTRASLAALE
ncbi:epoxyqueuosine reductase [Chloroflexota bacterium]